MSYPYAVNHFFCGCHVVEHSPGLVSIADSRFCGGHTEDGCKYEEVYRQWLLEEQYTEEKWSPV